MQSDLTDISHIFNHKKNPQQRQESATHFLFFYHLSGTGLLRRPLSVPPEPPSTLPSIGSNFHFQHHRIHRLASPHTHPHNTEQLRAQKGGARGGKTGFATVSAFPLAMLSPSHHHSPINQLYISSYCLAELLHEKSAAIARSTILFHSRFLS